MKADKDIKPKKKVVKKKKVESFKETPIPKHKKLIDKSEIVKDINTINLIDSFTIVDDNDKNGGYRSMAYLKEIDKWILSQMLQGKTNAYIVDILIDKYKFSLSNAKYRITTLLQYIQDVDTQDINLKIEQYKSLYLDLYERNLNMGNTRGAREILDSLAKLEGLLINKAELKLENTFTILFD